MNKYIGIPDFLADLDSSKKEQVELLDAIINEAHPGLTKHLKWNAPSYVLNGDDRVTFNLQNKENLVILVLHMGAKRAENKKAAPVLTDSSGLITWYSDTRGVLTFTDLADIKQKRPELASIISRWLKIS